MTDDADDDRLVDWIMRARQGNFEGIDLESFRNQAQGLERAAGWLVACLDELQAAESDGKADRLRDHVAMAARGLEIHFDLAIYGIEAVANDELADPPAATTEMWPHVCGECGEDLVPTMRFGTKASTQWLHRLAGVGHVPVPLLLPPDPSV